MMQKTAALAVAICGLVTLIAIFLPWYSVSFEMPSLAKGPTEMHLNGTQGGYSGSMILLLAALGGVAGVLVFRGPPPGFPVKGAVLAIVVVGAFGLATLATVIDVLGQGPGGIGTVRPALWKGTHRMGIFVTLAATASGTAFGWVLYKWTSARPRSSPPSSPPTAPSSPPDAAAPPPPPPAPPPPQSLPPAP